MIGPTYHADVISEAFVKHSLHMSLEELMGRFEGFSVAYKDGELHYQSDRKRKVLWKSSIRRLVREGLRTYATSYMFTQTDNIIYRGHNW